jgi:uncharacterized protein (TIGR02246 family)
MKIRRSCVVALAVLVSALTARAGPAAPPKGDPADMDSIAKQAEAFVAAFHKGDAATLAAFWAPGGDYTDQNGRRLKGRKAIEAAFLRMFSENQGLKLRIDSEALRFLTPDIAVEDGTTAVIPAGGGLPSRARYTIVHVKLDGQWLLGSVRESVFVPPGNHGHLRGLDWAIGDWASEPAKGPVERISAAWTDNQNFIVATFSTTAGDVTVGGATQWIGWDPIAKRVRSWIFDAAGGFGEGAWSREGQKWVIKTNSVRQDGKKAAATYVVRRVDADTIGLRATDRSVDGQAVPPMREIMLKRVK